MAKTQEELQRFRDIVASRPDKERKSFIKTFESLPEDKKDMAVSRVLAQSPAERTRVSEANIIAQEGLGQEKITGVGQAPPLAERLGQKAAVGIHKGAPFFGQMGGGIAGGLITKTPAGRAAFSALGGVGGRAIGLTAKSLASGKGLPEKKEFLRDIKTTAITEALFGTGALVGGHLIRGAGRQIEEAFLGKRVARRIQERGTKSIFKADLYKGRVPRQLALKASRFYDKIIRISGKSVDDAINAPGVKDMALDYKVIRQELAENFKGIRFQNFEGSAKEKKLMARALKLVSRRRRNKITPPELWEMRKAVDKMRYNNYFKSEGKDFMSKLRTILNKPFRSVEQGGSMVDENVVRKFQNYSTVRDSESLLARKFEVKMFDGDTFSERLEKFAKNLLGTSNDEQMAKLKAFENLLGSEDKVTDDLLDFAVAESIDKTMDVIGIFNRILFATFGGKRAFIRTGQVFRDPVTKAVVTGAGRAAVTGATEIGVRSDE